MSKLNKIILFTTIYCIKKLISRRVTSKVPNAYVSIWTRDDYLQQETTKLVLLNNLTDNFIAKIIQPISLSILHNR